MTTSRVLYALIALAALAFPVRGFVMWFFEYGFDLSLLHAELTATVLGRDLTRAMLLASLAALIFMVGECLARRDMLGLIAVPVTLVFGLAVGLPVYLILRLRQVD